MAEDMAIDVPHIWLYLAEQIVPMLQEGGIPMEQLFRCGPIFWIMRRIGLCPFPLGTGNG